MAEHSKYTHILHTRHVQVYINRRTGAPTFVARLNRNSNFMTKRGKSTESSSLVKSVYLLLQPGHGERRRYRE